MPKNWPASQCAKKTRGLISSQQSAFSYQLVGWERDRFSRGRKLGYTTNTLIADR
jgi:hypothetical protein